MGLLSFWPRWTVYASASAVAAAAAPALAFSTLSYGLPPRTGVESHGSTTSSTWTQRHTNGHGSFLKIPVIPNPRHGRTVVWQKGGNTGLRPGPRFFSRPQDSYRHGTNTC